MRKKILRAIDIIACILCFIGLGYGFVLVVNVTTSMFLFGTFPFQPYAWVFVALTFPTTIWLRFRATAIEESYYES